MWQILQILFLKLLLPPHPPPQKKKEMDEFNLRPAQYCINKNIWPDQILYLGDFKMDVIK